MEGLCVCARHMKTKNMLAATIEGCYYINKGLVFSSVD